MRINHLTTIALVLGILAGSYGSARADYAFARQIVDFTMAASPATAIAAPVNFTGTLNDSSSGSGNNGSFNNNSAFPIDISQVPSSGITPENTFGSPPIGPIQVGVYARADAQVATVGQNAGGAIEAIASLVAEADVSSPFFHGFQLGTATWNVTIPFTLAATSSLGLSASVPASPDSSGPGVILTAGGSGLTFASDSFSAILKNSVGGTVFTWSPDHLNERIPPFGDDRFSGVLQTSTQTLAAGSYTLTLSAGVVAFAIPEPASIVTAGMGLLGVLGFYAWRRFSPGGGIRSTPPAGD